MGLFNKLKNALFEEEEIEIPIKETPEVRNVEVAKPKEEAITPKKSDLEVKNIDAFLDEENERDLFKAENTFKFPEFDEEEFKSSYKPPMEKAEEKRESITPKESFDRVKPITYEFDKKAKQARKEPPKIEVSEEAGGKKSFKPSPVISPVYGVLDKNYKKEDIITVKEEKPKKKFDVDAIRKKAFGTLEDDIERTFEEPKDAFYNKGNENIDDLINQSTEEKVDLYAQSRPSSREARNEKHTRAYVTEEKEKEEVVPNTARSTRYQEEEDFDVVPEVEEVETKMDTTRELQVLDEEPKKTEKEKFEEDTLENDLFDLIDSMYDSREDEEE